MTHRDTTALRDRIAGLDDEHAITTLAHVLARLGYQPNPFRPSTTSTSAKP